ncbi:MAG: polyhydroxyalkanoic acid system family protein [Bacteroidales bacterium]|nr:polyhydroxyalkanoic acid system family protein [Bacteroidales bacterium]
MEVKVDHQYSQDVALEKMKHFFEQMKREHGDKVSDLKEEWNGNSGDYACKFNGMSLNGHIDVNEHDITLNGKLPLFAMPFKGVIESTIRAAVQNALNAEIA